VVRGSFRLNAGESGEGVAKKLEEAVTIELSGQSDPRINALKKTALITTLSVVDRSTELTKMCEMAHC
jgi:hypothetical protein